jgi:hypothetical protein
VQRLLRTPAPPTAAPAGAAQPAQIVDPDANEAEWRGAVRAVMHFDALPHVDQKTRSPAENEAAAQYLVLLAFGGEKNMNDVFDTLPKVVKDAVDGDAAADVVKAKKAGETPDADQVKTANRAQFLGRMRLYFHSWAEVLNHFNAIERVNDGPVDVFLHRDAAERLRRALAVLKNKGHGLPTIHEGFSLRKRYRPTGGDPHVESKGMMTHAMGYAFDISAKTNPRITVQAQGPEKREADLLAVTVGEKAARMNIGDNSLDVIAAMGQRTAGDLVAAADDTDAKTVQFFQVFQQQFEQMQAGSQAFRGSLMDFGALLHGRNPLADTNALLKIRTDYLDVLAKMRTTRDAKEIEKLEKERRGLLAQIPSHLTLWLQAIDTEIQSEIKKHPGMERLRSPSEISRDLATKTREVQQLTKDEAAAAASVTRARAEREAAKSALERARAQEQAQAQALSDAELRAQSSPRHGGSGGDWDPHGPAPDPRVEAARKAAAKAKEALEQAKQTLNDKLDALGAAVVKESETSRTLRTASTASSALKTELQGSNLPALQKSWGWIDRLHDLRQSLAAPDLTSAAGVRTYERLMTGDLSERTVDLAVDNPPLIRLLETGYFNPTGNFDLAFFEEVVHSGFWPGSSWSIGWVDSMHFELAQGRKDLEEPGK